MSLEKLSKQLRRDMAANPKKAAALGLMIVVALYFWGPLVWKLFSAGGPKRSNANMASLILTDDPAEGGQKNLGRNSPKFRWEKVRQLVQRDARMTSAAFDVAWIDPFAKQAGAAETVTVAEASPEKAVASAAAAAAAALDPNNLGVVLNSVMIGRRSRVATINGDSYREGDLLSITDKHDKSVSYEFRVLRIGRSTVQLEGKGRTFELELAPPRLAEGDDIERKKRKRGE